LGVDDTEAEHSANDGNVKNLDDVQLPEVVTEPEEGVVAGADPEGGDDGPGDANVLGSRLTNLADWRRSEGTKSRQEASGVTVTVSEMPQRCSRSFAVALEMATTPAAASALARAHLE
jgi:hypothetical protein